MTTRNLFVDSEQVFFLCVFFFRYWVTVAGLVIKLLPCQPHRLISGRRLWSANTCYESFFFFPQTFSFCEVTEYARQTDATAILLSLTWSISNYAMKNIVSTNYFLFIRVWRKCDFVLVLEFTLLDYRRFVINVSGTCCSCCTRTLCVIICRHSFCGFSMAVNSKRVEPGVERNVHQHFLDWHLTEPSGSFDIVTFCASMWVRSPGIFLSFWPMFCCNIFTEC